MKDSASPRLAAPTHDSLLSSRLPPPTHDSLLSPHKAVGLSAITASHTYHLRGSINSAALREKITPSALNGHKSWKVVAKNIHASPRLAAPTHDSLLSSRLPPPTHDSLLSPHKAVGLSAISASYTYHLRGSINSAALREKITPSALNGHKSWKVVAKNIHASPLQPLRLGEKISPDSCDWRTATRTAPCKWAASWHVS